VSFQAYSRNESGVDSTSPRGQSDAKSRTWDMPPNLCQNEKRCNVTLSPHESVVVGSPIH
jgi:hypothetical protein